MQKNSLIPLYITNDLLGFSMNYRITIAVETVFALVTGSAAIVIPVILCRVLRQ